MEFEPYIFAALNSAKVMLAVGTDYEYYNAVWVKNEWSRYLKLMEQDKSKHLIPCFKGIDAYDMPREFARLQAQDMGKVGAMQDLLRGIEKILPREAAAPAVQETMVVSSSGNSKLESLLDRGYMALEDGDWEKADGFFEEVLNNDSKNARAYLGKTLAQEKCPTLDAFVRKRKDAAQTVRGETLQLQPDEKHIAAAVKRFRLPGYVTEDSIRALYDFDLSYHSDVAERQRQYTAEEKYWADHKQLSRAEKFATGAVAEHLAREKKALLAALTERMKKAQFADVAEKKKVQEAYAEHRKRADEKAEALYQQGAAKKQEYYGQLLKIARESSDMYELNKTAQRLDELGDYQNSRKLAEHCRRRIDEEQARQDAEKQRKLEAWEKERKALAAKKKRIGIISGSAAAVVLAVIILLTQVIIPNGKYNDAVALMEAGDRVQAAMAFAKVDYKDSAEQSRTLWDKIAVRKSVSSGSYHTVGLKTDGTVVAVGSNGDGRCDVSDWTDIVAVSAGDCHTVGLKSDGTVVAVGSNGDGRCDVSDWTDIVAVSAGDCHTVGLKSDGTVVAVGWNSSGRCDVSGWTDIVAVSAGYFHTVGLKTDGTVVAVGYNKYGQCNVSDWTDIKLPE